ncbi:MAG: hypothetical protein LC790_16170 [Actinobacteria bacterium]|nr:hypothetical protein [Actinomycetota bacterium]
MAACRLLDLPDVPVVVRDHEGSSADSAVENVTRKQLTPLEEARAVQAMLDEGYTADGAAQALGWSRQLVTARAKILKLPAVGQQLVGMGEIPVSAIDNLLAIGEVSQPIVQAVVEAIATQQIGGSQLLHNAGWAIGQALRGAKGTFGEYLNHSCTTATSRRCGWARRPRPRSPRPSSCISRSIATPTGRRRSGSPRPTSTRRVRPAC